MDAVCAEIMGLDGAGTDCDISFLNDRLLPDDREKWTSSWGALLSGKRDGMDCDVRFTDPSGGARWVSVTGRISARDGKGNPTRVAGLARSVAKEKAAEHRLLDSEEKHRVIFNSSGDALMVLNRGRVSECNRQAVRMFGCADEEELIAMPLYRLLAAEQPGGKDVKRAASDTVKAARAWESTCREMVFSRMDGTAFHAEVIMVCLQYCGEEQIFTVIRNTDLNYVLNERIREGTDLVRALIDTPSDPVMLIDVHGTILALNGVMSQKLGVPRESAVGSPFYMFLHPRAVEQRRKDMKRLMETRREVRFEGSLGDRRYDIIMYPIKNEQGAFERIAVFCRDITEMRRLQQDIMEISELERTRIGQDLHDGLGQKLTGIAFLSQALFDSMTSRGYPEAADMKEILDNVTDSIEQTRRISRGLWSVVMDFHDLAEILNEFTSEVRDVYGIACHLRIDGNPRINNTAVVNNLYFVCRESVNNSIRHGRATRIEIMLSEEDSTVLLEVLDNGCGSAAQAVDGIGMKIMRYRTDLIGGTFTAKPESPGYRVSVRIDKTLL